MKKLKGFWLNSYLNCKSTVVTLLLIILFVNEGVKAQMVLDQTEPKELELDVVRNKWMEYTDASNSLYHHISSQVYVLLKQRADKISAIQTLEGWQQKQKWIRDTFLEIVGPFPEKTPLNAKIVRTINMESYRIEHIIFESQPGFYVTSSLFIPAGLKKGSKAPVVIYVSGHTLDGYRGYRNVILNLVKKGFIVFAFDPIGQGERLGYFDTITGKTTVGGIDEEHSYPGAQNFITGSSAARYFIWDGIRAVDYLITRKEVDPSRIGITGRSGGGTQSAYIAAFDDRIIAAAPEAWITNFTRQFQNIGPQDAEQNLFNGIARGIDHADFLLVRAPKPTLVITTTGDFFNIQGARETSKEVSRIFKAYGKEDNFGMVEDIGPHQSTQKNREAMYAFFQKHLNNPGSPVDEVTEAIDPKVMQITATGQLSTSLGGETLFSLNKKESEKLVDKLQVSRGDLVSHLPKVISNAKKLSGYREPSEISEPVFTGRIQREGYVIEKYFVNVEGDYVIPYLLMIPDKPNNKALIYLHPSGKAAEASKGGEIEWFVRNGFTVLAPDIIGVGEMGPGVFKGDAYIDGVSHNIWYCSMHIGRSIVGIRAGDVVRLTRLLKKSANISEVYGVARKEMAPVLLHAAAFDQDISRIALIEPYSSYSSLVMNRFYISKFILSTVPGAIKAYDLPDLEASLAPRMLLMAGVTDGNGKSSDIEGINEDLAIIKTAYHNINSEGQLNIVAGELIGNPYNLYMEWIK